MYGFDFDDWATLYQHDPVAFEAAMMRAIWEWPLSCEAALTTPSLNRRAFMGHAGCCIATGSPEDLTRLAWHRLDKEQQDAANAAADRAIEAWEKRRPLAGFWEYLNA